MLQAPFPYFGGKTAVADLVWSALGNVKHYIEPFFGSGAVLLLRPKHDPISQMETICDADGFIANVWRALQAAPDEVAKVCDWPVNHADLSARKLAMLRHKENLLEKLIADEKYFDIELAGYWIWAASCWIGAGLTSIGQRPHICNGDMGVHKLSQIPHISSGGKGVHKLSQIPHISDGGKGVHKLSKRPHISDGGKGVQEPYNTNLHIWFRELSERLRYVRVVCGDWTRVCGGNWQNNCGVCGIFFDPPYGEKAMRCNNLYGEDSLTVADDVRAWCIKRGDKKDYRIVLAGYVGEHEELSAHGWMSCNWQAQGGYGNLGDGQGKENKKREILWFSPHCLKNDLQPSLF